MVNLSAPERLALRGVCVPAPPPDPMRLPLGSPGRLLPLLLAFGLAACTPDSSPDDAYATDDAEDAAAAVVTDGGPAVVGDAAVGAGDAVDAGDALDADGGLPLEGDWAYCSGPSVLDTAAMFEDGRLNTYIDGRPGMAMPFKTDADAVTLDDGSRYGASVDGDLLTLTTAADGDAVYARSPDACP